MIDNPIDKPRCGRVAAYLPLIQATDGLTLSQVCVLSGLGAATIQNWIKRGFVPHPVGKKYHARHLARILLIAALRESMQIDRIGALLGYINGDTDDESDDIITEEALYDLFCEITEELSRDPVPFDRIGQRVEKYLIDAGYRDELERLCTALTVMVYTYIANVYKRGADRLYEQRIDASRSRR